MTNRELLLGTRVVLSPQSKWADVKNNPLNCEGTVLFSEFSNWVFVRWDNDEKNVYDPKDSDLIPTGPLGEFGYHPVENNGWEE
jgi:hypothetical protein